MSAKKVYWKEKHEIQDWNGVIEFEKQLYSCGPVASEKPEKRRIFRGERLEERLEQLYFPKKEDNISQSQQRQNESEDYLEAHLEKAFRLSGIMRDDKTERETELIRKFQRKAALYLEREPDKDDILEWLAIMRHHGAPTRLQDWGYSFYVAVYFALNANEKGIVWALDTSKMTPELVESLAYPRPLWERRI